MDAPSLPDLDNVLHQPVRTRIAAFLAARGEATFKELKKELDITDGNLDAHLKKLLASDYLVSTKQPATKGRPQTLFRLTPAGREAFEEYIETLKRVLSPIFNIHEDQ